ncbi:MAG: hypothetical protein ACI97A_003173 [Planctomycetota bacterium]|jgi:hypothetical protein
MLSCGWLELKGESKRPESVVTTEENPVLRVSFEANEGDYAVVSKHYSERWGSKPPSFRKIVLCSAFFPLTVVVLGLVNGGAFDAKAVKFIVLALVFSAFVLAVIVHYLMRLSLHWSYGRNSEWLMNGRQSAQLTVEADGKSMRVITVLPTTARLMEMHWCDLRSLENLEDGVLVCFEDGAIMVRSKAFTTSDAQSEYFEQVVALVPTEVGISLDRHTFKNK